MRRVFRLFTRSRVAGEVDEELAFHLEGRIRELEAAGMSRADAEREARKRFGDYAAYRAETKRIDETSFAHAARIEWREAIARELRHAARVLLRTPAFTAIAFTTLAIGIGATTAIYSVLEGVVLRPLPYPEPDRVVSLLHPTTVPGTGEGKWGLASVGYFHFRDNARSLAKVGAYGTSSYTVSDPGRDAIEARVGRITASVFDIIGARPSAGRLFTADDDVPGAPAVAVLSYEFWRRQYGEDARVVGQTMQTLAGPMQIIGVAQPGLTLPKPGPFASSANLAGFGVDFWVPLKLNPATRQNNHQYAGIARLAPGVTLEAAQRELTDLTRRFPEIYPDVYSPVFMQRYNFRVAVTRMHDEVVGPTVTRSLWLLFAAVALVLAIACANVANLFVVRMEARRRESAIRSALGGGRLHMAIHFLAESLLLTLAAGIAGILLARVGLVAILLAAPRSIPRLTGVEIGWSSAAVALALATVAGILLGLLPLARSGVDIDTLRESSRGLTPSRAQRLLRDALVVGQVALALMLLAGAGLMIRSFMQLRDVRPGIDPKGVMTTSISLPYRGSYDTMDKALAFYRAFGERIGAIPGVVAVGGSQAVPLRDYGTGCSVVFPEGVTLGPGEEPPCVHTVPAIPGFFRTLGITVRGRAPEWSDVDGMTQAVVVTQALADRLWAGEDAIGKGLNTYGGDKTNYYRVVGVVPELRAGGLDQPPTEALFMAPTPLFPAQAKWGNLNQMELVVKVAKGDPLAIVPQIRAILREMNPSVPLVDPVSMTTIVERSMARTSFVMLLLAIAAAMALILSAVGIYGVISYLVALRRQEIGVRIALGSSSSRVVAMVMQQSLALTGVGLALGMTGAFAAGRVMQSLLFNVKPADPVVLTVVPIVLLGIACVASFAPARRAVRVSPVEALRA
jgi:putative ABC transport system permease protein